MSDDRSTTDRQPGAATTTARLLFHTREEPEGVEVSDPADGIDLGVPPSGPTHTVGA
jgi:hypothetical protein